MIPDKVMSADEVIRLIMDGDAVGSIDGRGDLCEATMLHQAAVSGASLSGALQDLTWVQVIACYAPQERRPGAVINDGLDIPNVVVDGSEPMARVCCQP